MHITTLTDTWIFSSNMVCRKWQRRMNVVKHSMTMQTVKAAAAVHHEANRYIQHMTATLTAQEAFGSSVVMPG